MLEKLEGKFTKMPLVYDWFNELSGSAVLLMRKFMFYRMIKEGTEMGSKKNNKD